MNYDVRLFNLLETRHIPYDISEELNDLYRQLKETINDNRINEEDKTFAHIVDAIYDINHENINSAITKLDYAYNLAIKYKQYEHINVCKAYFGIIEFKNGNNEYIKNEFPVLIEDLIANDYIKIANFLKIRYLDYYGKELDILKTYEMIGYVKELTNFKNLELVAYVYIHLAYLLVNLCNNNSLAISYLHEAITLARKIEDKRLTSYILFEIAHTFTRTQSTLHVLKYAEACVKHEGFEDLDENIKFNARRLYFRNLCEVNDLVAAQACLDQIVVNENPTTIKEHVYKGIRAELLAQLQIRAHAPFKEIEANLRLANDTYEQYTKFYPYKHYKQVLLLTYGDLYFKNNDYSYALHYYKQVINLLNSSKWNLKEAYERLALTYEALNDFAKSKHMYELAMDIIKKIDIENNSLRNNLNLIFKVINDDLIDKLNSNEHSISTYLDYNTLVYNDQLLEDYTKFYNHTLLSKDTNLSILSISFKHIENNKFERLLARTILHSINDYTTKVINCEDNSFICFLNNVDLNTAKFIAEKIYINFESVVLQNELADDADLEGISIGISSAHNKDIKDAYDLVFSAKNAMNSIMNTNLKITIN